MGQHMASNILRACINSPSHPQLARLKAQGDQTGTLTPGWTSLKDKPKKILICDPSHANIDKAMKRFQEEMQGQEPIELAVAKSKWSTWAFTRTLSLIQVSCPPIRP